MAPNRNQMSENPAGTTKPPPPSPSASIILISPTNEILLLHRVQKASAFPSAHVFPGGNLSKSDGALPTDPKDPARHTDCLAYRTGAIRELFEESGVLLARKDKHSESLLEVSTRDRARGRKAVHGRKVPFNTWLSQQNGGKAILDTEALVPFTHWVTPPGVPKRFTTQMYVYFVPLSERGNASVDAVADDIETMAAEWAPAHRWLERSRKGEIILFPPQFILLYLVSQHLDVDLNNATATSEAEILARRENLKRFIETDSSPPWKEKFISPIALRFGLPDGRVVLGLEKPGPELKESGLRGEMERVVLVKFRKEGPREVDVGWRRDVLAQLRKSEEDEKKRKGEGAKL